jgi:hypothetical protein
VVGVAVSCYQQVDTADSMATQTRQKHRRVATTVNKHNRTTRITQQHRIALAYVEEDHGRDAWGAGR